MTPTPVLVASYVTRITPLATFNKQVHNMQGNSNAK
jgi:hypothetical protein